MVVWSESRKLSVSSKKICLVSNLTWEATVTKLLTAGKDIKLIKELMAKDLAGEIIQ